MRRKRCPGMLRDQGRKAVVPHEPVQGREVVFLIQFRHVHGCNSPLRKWPHVQPGVLIRGALAQVRIAVRAEHVEWATREILRLGALPFHHRYTGQDIRGKARVQAHHTGIIKEFDSLALTDAAWRASSGCRRTQGPPSHAVRKRHPERRSGAGDAQGPSPGAEDRQTARQGHNLGGRGAHGRPALGRRFVTSRSGWGTCDQRCAREPARSGGVACRPAGHRVAGRPPGRLACLAGRPCAHAASG